MDVVKRNIENLRGKVEIESEMGKGTRFCIRLPLTLAIIDGMLVRVGSERFIIPTTSIEQSLRPQPAQISTVQNRGEMLRTRKQLVPLVQLGEMFRLTGRLDPTATMVLITHTDCGEVGLVVDELIGQQQVVIKALGEQFRRLPGITGAAILGDGRVGLILDPSGVRAGWDRWKASTIRPVSTAPLTAEAVETAQPPAAELVGAGVEA
jgi:two-component system chemotaxis sensor kinase CheA